MYFYLGKKVTYVTYFSLILSEEKFFLAQYSLAQVAYSVTFQNKISITTL
jgi:hypothetical protein